MERTKFENPVLEAIYTRRSVRNYTEEPVSKELVYEIIKAGTWAPSGLNNQPWRFVIVQDQNKRLELAELTRYGEIIKNAPVVIAVFVDKNAMYHEVKDHQAMGACIENMLLAAHALGLGAVWLGEILKNAEEVRQSLDLPENLELMAVVALGHPKTRDQKSSRKPLEEVILKEYW
ncbi:nitroreductase [Thermodesulfatator indicus DSM 15286]|uniref:Nitroreductase n=1 Tax=Thermodesulfatator indicus (strain DSM 15286 / JCM 11887 / CIR29812) TaxID=667014 RepID=F8A840_THEID|nr:nitroreductase [Thermodesulfatator indicus]AEH45033.1 nitroreductase [Thermodesulfatator indicus DSM 15286]